MKKSEYRIEFVKNLGFKTFEKLMDALMEGKSIEVCLDNIRTNRLGDEISDYLKDGYFSDGDKVPTKEEVRIIKEAIKISNKYNMYLDLPNYVIEIVDFFAENFEKIKNKEDLAQKSIVDIEQELKRLKMIIKNKNPRL